MASGESFAAGAENGRDKSNANLQDEVDTVLCSRSTQGKRYRKASTVCSKFAINWLDICHPDIILS